MVKAFLRVLRRLRRRRTRVAGLAQQAATLIDPDRPRPAAQRAPTKRAPEYQAMVAAAAPLARRPPAGALRHELRHGGDQCITVLDTGETESEVSHCGDPWLPEDELARVLAGESLVANVLNADDFGVWVSGIAPVRDGRGDVVGAITVDAPVVESLARGAARRPLSHPGGHAAVGGHPLQPRRGRGHHRRPHRPLQPPLPARAPRRGARARRASRAPRCPCCSATATTSRTTTTRSATRPATPPWRASRASSRRAAGASTWPRATGARSSCSCWSTPTPPTRSRVAERIRAEVEASSTKADHRSR